MRYPQQFYDVGVIYSFAPAQPYLRYVFIMAAGSEGNLTFNDAASMEEAGPGNEIFSMPCSDLVNGQSYDISQLCTNGLVLSELPTGGIISVGWEIVNSPNPYDPTCQPLLVA